MTTYSGQGIDIPMVASGDLNSVQYRFVTVGGGGATDKAVIQATGASNPFPIGVLQNDPNDGEAARVRVAGTSLVYADAAASQFVYGGQVTVGSTGMALPQGGQAACKLTIGMAFQAFTSGSGVLVEVLLGPPAFGFGEHAS